MASDKQRQGLCDQFRPHGGTTKPYQCAAHCVARPQLGVVLRWCSYPGSVPCCHAAFYVTPLLCDGLHCWCNRMMKHMVCGCMPPSGLQHLLSNHPSYAPARHPHLTSNAFRLCPLPVAAYVWGSFAAAQCHITDTLMKKFSETAEELRHSGIEVKLSACLA